MLGNGTSPSGKAAGFGPAISEVRVLPSQILNSHLGVFILTVICVPDNINFCKNFVKNTQNLAKIYILQSLYI